MPQIFPRGANFVPLKIILVLALLGMAAPAAIWYYWRPEYTKIGYQPAQPIPFPTRSTPGSSVWTAAIAIALQKMRRTQISRLRKFA